MENTSHVNVLYMMLQYIFNSNTQVSIFSKYIQVDFQSIGYAKKKIMLRS